MIKPTVGRVVYFRPGINDPLHASAAGEPLAAHIVKVTDDTRINLAVFDTDASVHGRMDVALVQGETAPTGESYAEWMPYQKGQAAKTEALEQQAAGAAPRIARYRKKPVVIDAALFDGQRVGEPSGTGQVTPGTCPDWFPGIVKTGGIGADAAPGEILHCGEQLAIGTLEGTLRASPGDWIIRGVKGEIYPCKPDVFATTYEAA